VAHVFQQRFKKKKDKIKLEESYTFFWMQIDLKEINTFNKDSLGYMIDKNLF